MSIAYTFFNITNNIWKIISEYRYKSRIYILLLVTIITSFFELATISTVLPLLDLMINLKNSSNFNFLLIIADFFQIKDEYYKHFIFYLFGFFMLFSYIFKIILISLSAFVTHDISFYIHNNIFKKTISQEYSYFKNFNSSIFLGNLDKVEMCRGAIFNLLQLVISLILFISIIFLVSIIDFYTFFLFTILCLFFYLITYFFIKATLSKINFLGSKLVNSRYKLLLECTDNIKEIILRNLSI